MLRKFEHPGPPKKYLELDYREQYHPQSLHYRWYTEGRSAQDHHRTFDTHDEATRFAEAEIAKQLANGYVEVGQPAPSAPPVAAAPPADKAITLERTERFVGDVSGGPRFVRITQEGTHVVQTAGAAGATPEADVPDERARRFAVHRSVREASAAYEALARDLIADGFRSFERTDTGAPRVKRDVTRVSNPELEAECLAEDREDLWMVYADWLVEHDDPRGEIAQLHMGGHATEAKRVIAAHLEELCGDTRPEYRFEFRHGFVRGATIARSRDDWDSPDGPLDELVRAFLAAPLGRYVESLRLGLAGFSDANTWAPAIQAVIDSPCGARLRELRTDAWQYTDCEISWAPFGDLAFAWPQLPSLELLHLKSGGGGNLGLLELPRLRTLIRESGGLGAGELAQILEAIREGRLPALEHLELWTGAGNYGAAATTALLRPILDGEALPNLVHLGIVNSELANDVVDILAHSPLLPRLHSLDLSRGTLAERGTRHFVANAKAFRHLASIDLSRNLLVVSEVDAIRGVLDNVILVDQRERDDDDHDEDDPESEDGRYVDVGE